MNGDHTRLNESHCTVDSYFPLTRSLHNNHDTKQIIAAAFRKDKQVTCVPSSSFFSRFLLPSIDMLRQRKIEPLSKLYIASNSSWSIISVLGEYTRTIGGTGERHARPIFSERFTTASATHLSHSIAIRIPCRARNISSNHKHVHAKHALVRNAVFLGQVLLKVCLQHTCQAESKLQPSGLTRARSGPVGAALRQ